MRGSASPETVRPLSVKLTRCSEPALRRGIDAASSSVCGPTADQFAPVGGGRVHVVAGVEVPGESVERVVERAAAAAASRASPAGRQRRRPRAAAARIHTAAQATMAKSPWRRADLAKSAAGAGRPGNATASINSSSLRVGRHHAGEEVLRPVRGASALRCAVPPRRRAPAAPAAISALGSACAIEPQTVPRLRVCT